MTDEQQQSQYINMFKAAKMDAVILNHNIDQPFVSQLEAKNEGIKFQRIDADLTDASSSIISLLLATNFVISSELKGACCSFAKS